MRPIFFAVFGIFIFLYAMLNYYLGLRGWQALASYTYVNRKIYWLVFWIVSLSYLLGRLGQKFLPAIITDNLIVLGAYWIAAMFYFIQILLVIELIRLLDRWLGFIPESLRESPALLPLTGVTVVALVTGIVGYGLWNAWHPQIRNYEISVAKKAGNLKELHVVMASDIHLGTVVGKKRLQMMVDMANNLKPDVVLLVGDTIDESVEPFIEQKMSDVLRQLNTKYGVFAVLGNHEYIGGHAREATKHMQEAGVNVLVDKKVKVADSFYLIGRDDLSADRFGAQERRSVEALLKDVDKGLPVIVMDHQPSKKGEDSIVGVDLKLSGHTHQGQLWPNAWITRRMYEIDWGLLKRGNFHAIVSSGFGTWGPPIRTGTQPELVNIKIKFTGQP